MMLRHVALLALSVVSWPMAVAAERPTHDGMLVLFGNLHSHSRLSDDVDRDFGDEMLPAAAYEYAYEHGLDFLASSDHHKATDSSHRLFLTASEFETKLKGAADAFNADHVGEFVALHALEWGDTATGNHVNVVAPDSLPPNSVKNADYDELVAWATSHSAFVQFNHPYGWENDSDRNEDVGNFGEALYSSDMAFRQAIDPIVRTIVISNSVKGGHLTGKFRLSDDKTHRTFDREDWYLRYLNKGLHLSPSADQDTHRTNWGTVTAARTAVWASACTQDALLEAFKANRVYATEDDEMAVAFQVEVGGVVHWMGETVTIPTSETSVTVVVRVSQAVGSDGDPTDEGPYRVELLSDSDGVGGEKATVWDEWTVASNTTDRREVPVLGGEYILLKVTEQGGKDNDVGDNRPSNMNDVAWTSPIWFKRAGAGGGPHAAMAASTTVLDCDSGADAGAPRATRSPRASRAPSSARTPSRPHAVSPSRPRGSVDAAMTCEVCATVLAACTEDRDITACGLWLTHCDDQACP